MWSSDKSPPCREGGEGSGGAFISRTRAKLVDAGAQASHFGPCLPQLRV
jgi:hypothetical protein